LELVRDGLRLHPDCIGQVTDAQLALSGEGVEEPEPRIVGEDLEEIHQPGRLFGRDERSLIELRLRRAAGRWLAVLHAPYYTNLCNTGSADRARFSRPR
jgi:hypothetical protein